MDTAGHLTEHMYAEAEVPYTNRKNSQLIYNVQDSITFYCIRRLNMQSTLLLHCC